jgi:hypothetical protein
MCYQWNTEIITILTIPPYVGSQKLFNGRKQMSVFFTGCKVYSIRACIEIGYSHGHWRLLLWDFMEGKTGILIIDEGIMLETKAY